MKGTTVFQIYIKSTANCDGLPLQSFERLGPEWSGASLRLPFGEPGRERILKVVGWTDLFGGVACPVHVARVRRGGAEGYLIWGGNAGVRIMDARAKPIQGVDDHLPAGHGWPIVWVARGDVGDLPAKVRKVVARGEGDD